MWSLPDIIVVVWPTDVSEFLTFSCWVLGYFRVKAVFLLYSNVFQSATVFGTTWTYWDMISFKLAPLAQRRFANLNVRSSPVANILPMIQQPPSAGWRLIIRHPTLINWLFLVQSIASQKQVNYLFFKNDSYNLASQYFGFTRLK